MSVSSVARQEEVAASLLFLWRKLERKGALTAVPASELAASYAEIAKLQRVLNKKTVENKIPKDAVEYAAEKVDCALALAPGMCSEDAVSGAGRVAFACS